jgi:hypothetical protein
MGAGGRQARRRRRFSVDAFETFVAGSFDGRNLLIADGAPRVCAKVLAARTAAASRFALSAAGFTAS